MLFRRRLLTRLLTLDDPTGIIPQNLRLVGTYPDIRQFVDHRRDGRRFVDQLSALGNKNGCGIQPGTGPAPDIERLRGAQGARTRPAQHQPAPPSASACSTNAQRSATATLGTSMSW